MDLYEGDKVVIEECKPLSKNKHFKVIEIIKAAPRVSEMKDDEAIDKVIHREKTGADEEAKAKKESEKNDSPESPATNSLTTES